MLRTQTGKLLIYKQQVWLFFLFPFLFVADILYGIIDYYNIRIPISPGEILRGLVFLLSIIMTLRYIRLINKKIILWIIFVILSLLPGIIVGLSLGDSLLQNFLIILRILYGPFVIILLLILIIKYNIKIDFLFKFIEFSAYVLGLTLFYSQFFGIQRETYGFYALGSTGVFSAQNDLTLALGLSVLSASYHLTYSFSFLRMILIGLSLFACVNIGTRASLAVVSGASLVVLILVLWGDRPEKKKLINIRRIKLLFAGFIVTLVMVAILLYGLNLQQQSSYQQKKINFLAEGNLPRSVLIQAAESHLESRPWYYRFTGEGMTSFTRGVGRYYHGRVDNKLTEVDYIDLFGAHGFFLPLLMYGFYSFLIFITAKRFLFDNKLPQSGLIAAALTMYIGHSALAGHAFTSPVVSTLIAGYAAAGIKLFTKNAVI